MIYDNILNNITSVNAKKTVLQNYLPDSLDDLGDNFGGPCLSSNTLCSSKCISCSDTSDICCAAIPNSQSENCSYSLKMSDRYIAETADMLDSSLLQGTMLQSSSVGVVPDI